MDDSLCHQNSHITVNSSSNWSDLLKLCRQCDNLLDDPRNQDLCRQINECQACTFDGESGICGSILCQNSWDPWAYCRFSKTLRVPVKDTSRWGENFKEGATFSYPGIPPCICLNGWLIGDRCKCQSGFTGLRCEIDIGEKSSEENQVNYLNGQYFSSTPGSTSESSWDSQSIVLPLIIVSFIVVFCLITYCIWGYYRAKRNVRGGACWWIFPDTCFRSFYHCWSTLCKRSHEQDDRPFIANERADPAYLVMQDDMEVLSQIRIGQLELAGILPQPLVDPEERSSSGFHNGAVNPSENPNMERVSLPPPVYMEENEGSAGHSSGQYTEQRLMPPSYDEALKDMPVRY